VTASYLLSANPGLRIAIVGKEIVGFGASGRNEGWCSSKFPVTLPYALAPALLGRFPLGLKFVPQGKLHDPRLRQQASVISESTGHLLQRGSTIPQAGLNVKSREVRYIENLPAELQAVAFEWQFPALAQAHVPARETISTKNIT